MTVSDKIAIGACIFAGLQFIALLLTICIMRDTEKRQVRAYIFPRGVSILNMLEKISDPSNGPMIKMLFENTGQSPAFEVTCRGDVWFNYNQAVIDKIPIKFDQNSWMSKAAMGPGVKVSFHTPNSKPMSDKEKDDFKSGIMVIVFKGKIIYKDAFKKTRHTFFCYCYSIGDYPKTSMTVFETGNEAY